jgi:hypothetical protein
MDKHDRPYKCAAEGCQKLPGFTYSGGLLRHEREVHNKHGGPKNRWTCPHATCKRHNGKGFSRLENLSEHLRRVHTQNGAGGPASGSINGGDSDDAGSETGGGAVLGSAVSVGAGVLNPKRKRDSETPDREEYKRVCQENAELRRQVDNLNRQTNHLLSQITSLQGQIHLLPSATDLLVGSQSSVGLGSIGDVPIDALHLTAGPGTLIS